MSIKQLPLFRSQTGLAKFLQNVTYGLSTLWRRSDLNGGLFPFVVVNVIASTPLINWDSIVLISGFAQEKGFIKDEAVQGLYFTSYVRVKYCQTPLWYSGHPLWSQCHEGEGRIPPFNLAQPKNGQLVTLKVSLEVEKVSECDSWM